MNDAKVVCPRCQKEVFLVKVGRVPTCPECGTHFPYRAQGGTASGGPQAGLWEELGDIFHALLKVFLIMVAIVVVGLAVLFAGCALMLGGMH